MSADDVQRDLGRAEGRLGALEHDVHAIKSSLETQGVRLGNIEKMIAEARGSWRTLMAIAGMASAIGSAVTWIIAHLPWR
mgnify:CR=1 FL=1